MIKNIEKFQKVKSLHKSHHKDISVSVDDAEN